MIETGQALEERDAELTALRGALDRALAGQGATVVLEGPAGIGKTRLLRELRALATAAGADVLAARAAEGESDFPFGVVRQLVERRVRGAADRDALLGGAAGLAAPVLGLAAHEAPETPDAPEPAFAALHGLYWLTSNLAAERPLVLVADDVQWADPASLRFLAYLARRVEDLPVLLAVGVRSTDPGAAQPALATLTADPAATVVRPAALSERAVARLATQLLGADPEPPFTAAVHAAAAGNPYFTTELLGALARDGVAPVAAEAERVATLGPRTVVHAILVRLASLPPGSADVAAALAVLGTEATVPRAAAVAGLPPDEAAAALDALARTGLLAPGAALAFAHPIVATAVEDELGPGRRALLHARAADALRAEGAEAGAIGRHLLLAPPGERPWAVEVLRATAAAAAGRGAPEIAVRALERSLLEHPEGDERRALVGELGAAALRAGDPAAVGHLRAASGPGTPALDRARHARLLARALAAQGRSAEAVDALGALADEVREESPETAMLLDADQASIGLTDPGVAARSAARLERHAGVAGATHAERVVLANLALRAWVGGADAATTRDVARRALAGGALLADETSDSVPLHQAVFALVVADGLEEADEQLAEAIDDARRRGSAYGFAASSTMRAIARLRAGRVTDAEADARAALDTGVEHALITPMTRGFLALALLESEAADEAGAVLDQAPPRAELAPALPSIHVAFARGLVALRRGDLQEAQAEIEAVAGLERMFGVESPILGWRLVLAATRAGTGDVAAARALVDDHLARAERWGSAAVHGSALRATALFHAGEEGLERRRAAVALLRGGCDRLELARGLLDLGVALRHGGDPEGAREPLTEALDLARGLGARATAERAHRQLQAAGARPRRLRFSGAEALTASERRVAELAARGMTNRDIAQALFVTAKTVENHLGRAYRKVGVSSREELGAALGDPHARS